MGFMVLPDGRLVILYKSCNVNSKIYSVAVRDAGTSAQRSDDDTVIWRIESDGSRLRGFVVGAEVEGFNTVVNDVSPLRPGQILRADFETDELQSDVEVLKVDALSEGVILVREERMSTEEFVRRSSCG